MVRIRLARAGAKKKPFYRIVVSSKRSGRDGGFVDRLGFLNPVAVGQETPLRIDTEKVDYWVARGASMSKRVEELVKFYHRHGEGESEKRASPSVSSEKAGSQSQPVPESASDKAE
ncbi:30S ribosomal protein S16 [Salinisphaera sp. USBA-960]|nr:30S ribosomal protein S16 [Salifodinibacter halophilus]NNC26256.1 30S ribosomal protein S16 [Salifodinibacter halophilus]